MDDARRSTHARVWAEPVLDIVDEERDLAFQDIERIGVPPMQVRVRAWPSAHELRFRHAKLLEIRLDHDPATEDCVTPTCPVNDPGHCRRV